MPGTLLFSRMMVPRVRDGSKTETRRLCADIVNLKPGDWSVSNTGYVFNFDKDGAGRIRLASPFGQPGNRLKVREDVRLWCEKRHNGQKQNGKDSFRFMPVGQHVSYLADTDEVPPDVDANPGHAWRLKPGRFMPGWASRALIETTTVSVERLRDITEEGAIAEGLTRASKDDGRTWKYGIPDRDGLPGTDDLGWPWDEWCVDPVKAYFKLWEMIHGEGSVALNPLVFVGKFKLVQSA